MTIDPVCKMKVDTDKAAAKAEHSGQMYYFCSEQTCRKHDVVAQHRWIERLYAPHEDDHGHLFVPRRDGKPFIVHMRHATCSIVGAIALSRATVRTLHQNLWYRHSTPIETLDPCAAPRLRILGCSLRLQD